MTRLIGRTDLLEIWCCCKTKEVLRSEEKATSDISESDMNEIRNKLQKLFPMGELTEYDDVADVFVNKDDLTSYMQSHLRNEELSNCIVGDTEDSEKRTDNNQDSIFLSAIPQRDMITKSVLENADERNMLESRLYDLLPDDESKKILSRVLQLREESGFNYHNGKQNKNINDISAEAVIHFETERNSSKGFTSISNYLFIIFSKRNRKNNNSKWLN